MKKYLFSFFFILFSTIIHAQSIDEILSKYELSNGGKQAFSALKTLQYNSTVSMNMQGMPIDINITNIVEKGKLYRRNMAGMMGMKGSYTLVTDTAGYTSTPTIPSFGDFPGMEGGIKKMSKEDLQSLQSKLNTIEDFATLVDVNSKGSKAELIGTVKVEKVDCYKIKLTNKTNDVAIYYIDIATMLTKQIELSGKQIATMLGLDGAGPMGDMISGRMDKQKATIIFAEYQTIGGIKFPTKQKVQFGAVDVDIENTEVQINQPIETKWYKAN
jgi:hypothetical protein